MSARAALQLLTLWALAGAVWLGPTAAHAQEQSLAPERLSIVAADGVSSVRFQALLQAQYEYRATAHGANPNGFRMRRAQLRFSGGALVPDLRYKIMLEMSGSAGGATVNLRDAWIGYRFFDPLQLRVGQFLLYDHENLQPSWALQMVDRSVAYDRFGFERDLGVELHGDVLSRTLEYGLFVVNGLGRNRFSENGWLRFGARLVLNLLGRHGYMVSDLEASSEPQLTIGLAGAVDPNSSSADGQGLWHATADAAFRWHGISTVVVAYGSVNEAADRTDTGIAAQTGVFVVPNRLELAARYARVWNNGGGDDDREQLSGVISYFVSGHGLKIQLEYNRLATPDGQSGVDHVVATQLQLFFL